MKVGTIITVYKGGKKDKRNPNSYRAITLSSYIYKGLITSHTIHTYVPVSVCHPQNQTGMHSLMKAVFLLHCSPITLTLANEPIVHQINMNICLDE